MGKNTILNKEQQTILAEVGITPFFRDNFYFTGGTALSEVYLQHRESVDLDFFSPKKFDSQTIDTLLQEWSQKHHFSFTSEFIEPTVISLLEFSNKTKVKVDFSYYPYQKLEKETLYNNLKTDSLLDIAANKLLTITQRTQIKDFVDLYFLLQKYTIWDLIYGTRHKFSRELEPFIVASDLTVVEEFTYLPKMIKPVDLEDIKSFFRNLAKKLGKPHIA